MNKNHSILILLYLLVLVTAYAFKHFYSIADVTDLKFMLLPISNIVGWMSSMKFNFVETVGYRNEEANIVINKTCAGINFFIIAFSMSICSFTHYFPKIKTKLGIALLLFAASYLLTIAANSFRISSAISLLSISKQFPLYLPQLPMTPWGLFFISSF